MPKKLKIAVTGGIGSGKSTVCDVFRSHGYTILNADQISKEILSTSQKAKERIISHFGKDSFKNDKPNKEYLADKVFNNQENLKILNSILHPPTIEKINREMQNSLRTNNIVFVEAALIYEANMEDMFDHVLLVSSPEGTRIDRIKVRDGVNEEQIKNRIRNQMSEDHKKKLADFVIENNKSLIELKIKAEFFLKIFESMTK